MGIQGCEISDSGLTDTINSKIKLSKFSISDRIFFILDLETI